jgi:phage shock protein C
MNHAKSTYPPKNRLYRASRGGMFLGVCAGISDYFGFDRDVTRLITAIGGLVFFPTVLIGYFVLGLLLKKAPEGGGPYDDIDNELRRRVRSEPHSVLDSQRFRFRDLDRRLQRLEKYVTSKRFRLEREFDGLRD